MITSATYCNSEQSAVIVNTDDRGAVAIQFDGPDNSGGLRDVYLQWAQNNATAPYEAPVANPLALAETHVASFFSTARLLQMKVWWDTFPVEDVPKLAAVFNWTGGITIQAAQGNTNFAAPPHTFEELLAEAMEILGVP